MSGTPYMRLIGLVALAAGLLGCASVPMPDLSVALPGRWRHREQLPARPPVDLHGWWKAFHDPALSGLVEQALSANLEVAQALERLRAERALYARRQAPNRPSLRIHTDDPIDPDATASYFVVGFDATWELALFGRGEATDRIAAGKLREAAATLREARVSLVAEIVREWIRLRAAQRRTQLLGQTLAARRRQAALVQTRVRLRLDGPEALARARASVAETQDELSGPAADADAAAQRLALLLGRSEPDPAWLKPAPLPQLGAGGPLEAPVNLLRSRPEIARAEAGVVQAAGDLGIARADLYPRIGLGTSLLWSTDVATIRHRSSTNQIGTLGPLIDIPLFDWGMRKAREDARAHQLKAAAMAYREAVLGGVAEVETALGNLQQQRRRENAGVRACRAWETAAGAVRKRRRLGLASDLDAADVDISRARADLNLTAARADRDVAYVALYKALGGAAPPPAGDAGHAGDEGDPP